MGGPLPEQSPPTSYTCQSISEQMSANESVLKQLFVIEAAAAEIRKTLGLAELVPATAGQSTGKSSQPKEKRPPSAWVVFSSQRVGSLVRKAEEEKEKKSPVGVVNQFAGHLWGQKKEWTDEEILAAWPTFTPPEVSKQALKKSSGSVSGEDEPEKKTGKGSRGPQSEEVKAAARLKRAANKAKKAAEGSAPVSEVASQASDEEAPADTFEEPEPEPVKPAPKPAAKPAEKPAEKPAPKPAESKPATKAGKKSIKKEWTKEELYCDEWEHDEEHYFKNARGDVLTTDGHWVGRWDGKKLDTNAAKPEDFSKIDSRPA